MEDVLQLENEIDIEAKGDEQEDQADDGEAPEAVADGAEVFDQLLLFERVAVGGFADPIQLIFDALEGGDLLLHLAAQFAVAVADLGQAPLDGLQIDLDDLGRLGSG